LTTIEIGARQIGEEAANLLLRRIKAPSGPPETVVLPPRLIIRSSCGGQVTDDHATRPASQQMSKSRDQLRRKAHDMEHEN
jgi:LacI family transcriptional regulator